ncbi:hypothetical protein [Falsirhodobacter deserti]|uniref:hypothetical protein n=1 Tax=Falsirhodobacter deserti TaxID=1365611 RepID=UPI000FE37B52|nr:hypothetical protein [Falsirhodobacter deserti]
MAIHTLIISPRHSEAAPSFRPSPVTVLFGAMMRNLSAYVEAERDLEHCGSWDPACDMWIRDAEHARTHVLDAIASLRGAPIRRAEDLPLRRCAAVAQMVIESDSPRHVRDILLLPDRFPHAFRCASNGPVARRVDLMVASFQHHLHALGALADIMDTVEADCCTTEPDAPETMLAPTA